MLLGARQFFAARRAAPLPYDAEVQYLESTGTQYIDTGIYCLKKYSFEFTVSVSYDGVSYEDYFGGSSSDSQRGWRFRRDGNNEKILFSIGNAYTSSGVAMSKNTPHLITMAGGGAATIDGNSVTLSGAAILFDSSVSLYLFAYSKNNSPYRISNAKFYSFKCTDADTGDVVRDMIPVRKNGVGYMYDRVSGQLLGNSGTGDFVIGPDKTSWTNPYVTDGLVAMWDGEWNAGGGVHDPNATVWKDLVGGTEILLNGAWSFGDNNLYIPEQTYGGSHIPIIIPTGETGQFDLCFAASGYISGYGWILDGGLGLGNALGPNINSTSGANADFPAGSSMELRYWTVSTLEIKRPYAYSVSFDGSNGRRITDGVISQFSAYTGNFNGVAVFNAYNYYRPVTGRIFNIRRYSRALTADEISTNYAIDKSRFNLP